MAIFVIENRIASNPVGSPSFNCIFKIEPWKRICLTESFNMPSERISFKVTSTALTACAMRVATVSYTHLDVYKRQVYTGVAILDYDDEGKRKSVVHAVETEVFVNPMSDEEIREYAATGEPLDKAGAYGIQGPVSYTHLKYRFENSYRSYCLHGISESSFLPATAHHGLH